MKVLKNELNNLKIRLKNIIKIDSGKGFGLSDYRKDGIRLFKIDNVSHGYSKWDNITYVDIINRTLFNNLLIEKEDILLALNRPITNGSLKITLAKEKDVGSLLYQRVGRIRKINNKNNQIYLYYKLKKEIYNFVNKNVVGGNIPFIKTSELYNLEIELVSLEQQNKIAQLLSEKEQHIENIKTLISKLEKRNEYYAEKLLSGELRVRENEKGEIEFYENTEWKEVKLNGKLIKIPVDWNKQLIKDIIKLQKGTSISSEDLNYENGIQYLRTNEIWQDSSKNKEEIYYNGDMSKIVTKNEDEFIICFDGYNNKPNEGTVGMVTSNGNGICSGELHKIKEIDKISRYYVNVMLLKNKRFQNLICRYGEGSTVKHSGKHFKKIEEILITYNEQLLLNEIFEKNIHEIKNLKKLIKKETKEFEWLSEKLLSGEYIIED